MAKVFSRIPRIYIVRYYPRIFIIIASNEMLLYLGMTLSYIKRGGSSSGALQSVESQLRCSYSKLHYDS